MAKSHYIPQFILRHFCNEDAIIYCDLQKKKVEKRNTKSVFSEKEYYPEELERSLCQNIEVQFATLLNNKILTSRYSINLSPVEMDILKKYLLITIFRNKINEPNELELSPYLSKEDIKKYKGDFYENLNKILECKTKEDMLSYIDWENDSSNITLSAYLRDILGSYIIFVSTGHCDEDFLIPDKGCASYEGPGKVRKLNATIDLFKKTGDPVLRQTLLMLTPHDYTVFPLSSNLAVIAMSPFYKLCAEGSPYKIKFHDEAPTLSSMLGFGSKEKIKPPKVRTHPENGIEYVYTLRTLNEDEVIFINSISINNAVQYIACADLNKIHGTIAAVNYNNEFSYMNMNRFS